ncbi:hypothetical protein MTO96_050637 [Rhipicephalus appendiculatus]
MIWCAAWLERTGHCENPQLYLLSPRRNGSAPACSARTRSGKGPGTRPGQASLLCADGRSRDSAREHEEADYVCRKQFPWQNSWVNDRDSTRPQRPPSYGIGRSTPSTRRPRRLHQTENPQLYLLSPRRNGSAPACSARTRSGKGPGTRPGQASLLCADGRSRDSAREHEEADYVCRKQFPWQNSWVNDRDSTRPQRPPSYGIGRSTPSTRRPRRLHQTV